jgi:Uma2 family endonuclease
MAPERLSHTETKLLAAVRLREAILKRSLPCQALGDGMAVRIDEATVYEPDALVRCGPRLPDDTIEITDPVIVVEVVSPSSRRIDAGAKLADYFRIPSVRHYLIMRTDIRTVIHHGCDAQGQIHTRLLREGSLDLDPPGITVEIEGMFG